MKWSRIEFPRKQIISCEDIGTLSITLKRTGDLNQISFVGIKVRDMSAKSGLDFYTSSSKQVQFNPGMYNIIREFRDWMMVMPPPPTQPLTELII